MSEILNLEAIEQQRILITVSLTGSDGAPVNPSDYVICAAAIGQPNPYTQRAVRKEWAASINNENSAFLLTCPGLDMAAAPWKYRILLKNRALELEWQIVSGRISLTPRACGTDGISPAAYSVACEATPSGLVNVTLDATVGSISGTLEEVKASAALASSSAANAHADLEDARKAATTAAQAATTAAADAKTAAEAATRAEQAATDAPQACAPFVGQVQAAAVQAQQAATHAEEDANRASTAATTATEKAQVATDAATAAAASAADLASARDTAVQAATTAQAAQQTAQLASTTATTAAENAREYAEDAQQAQQAAATSETNAATAAQQASDSASAAAASAQSAQAAAATAVSAKSDLETARDTAIAAATTASDAATAAASSETNATAAATAAATAQTAAEAAQAQADTDARACAIYDQRVAANATTAADSATAAADSATAAESSATAAAASAQRLMDEELLRMVDLAATAYGLLEMASVTSGVEYLAYSKDGVPAMSITSGTQLRAAKILVSNNANVMTTKKNVSRVFYSEKPVNLNAEVVFEINKTVFIHAPYIKTLTNLVFANGVIKVIFSDNTKFENTTSLYYALRGMPVGSEVKFVPGTTMRAVEIASHFAEDATGLIELPDEFTFESVKDFEYGFTRCFKLKRLPAAMTLKSCTNGTSLFHNTPALEIDDIIRVCSTINDLHALDTPKTGSLGLPLKCKHNGAPVEQTMNYLNANYPDFLTTLAAKGWTVTFG